jgi:hypothetical protein
MTDWMTNFIIPIIEVVVVVGIIGFITFLIVRALRKSWKKSRKIDRKMFLLMSDLHTFVRASMSDPPCRVRV